MLIRIRRVLVIFEGTERDDPRLGQEDIDTKVFGRRGDAVDRRRSFGDVLQRKARDENVVRELNESVTRGARHRPALTGMDVGTDDRARTVYAIPGASLREELG